MRRSFIIASILVLGCLLYAYFMKCDTPTTDAIRFRQEYEQYNDQIKANGSGYLSVNIEESSPIRYVDFNAIMKVLEEGTGIIYFGFPTCPWCRNAAPVLIEAAKKEKVKTIYYFNALSIRDTKYLDENGNIIVEKEGTKEYYQLLERLGNVADPYEGLGTVNEKRLYFPTILFVKDGNIVGNHNTTVDSQTDPSIALTKSQKQELLDIYQTLIRRMK